MTSNVLRASCARGLGSGLRVGLEGYPGQVGRIYKDSGLGLRLELGQALEPQASMAPSEGCCPLHSTCWGVSLLA